MSETNGHQPTSKNGTLMRGSFCSAQRKRGAGPCKGMAMANGKCRMHGGSPATGIALPQFKHGRYSQYMPAAIRDRYNEIVADPTLTHLRSEIGIVAMHLEAKILEMGDGQDFEKLQPMLEQLRKMVESENKRIHQLNQTLTTEQAMAFARQLGDAVKRHVTDPKTLAAIQSDFNRTLGR